MANSTATHVFPHDDALCESCGYPLKGLLVDAVCPECGLGVEASSPAKRTIQLEGHWLTLAMYWRMMGLLLFHPRRTFRTLALDGSDLIPEQFLFRTSFLAGLILSLIVYIGSAFVLTPRYHSIPLRSALWLFILTSIGITILTFIEMTGVTAFSRRRGWRVPFTLAMRICCLASVGWLPGAVVAGFGVWMIQAYGVGRPWFDHLLGLVRVGWLIYAGLFVLALLWFETLVWIAVRQVRFGNAWAQNSGIPGPEDPEK
jgi:hypothetical protein